MQKPYFSEKYNTLPALLNLMLGMSSAWQMFYVNFLKNFSNFTVKYFRQNLFLNKVAKLKTVLYWKRFFTPAKVFWCEFYEIFQSSFFAEHLRDTTASSPFSPSSSFLLLSIPDQTSLLSTFWIISVSLLEFCSYHKMHNPFKIYARMGLLTIWQNFINTVSF